MLIYVTRSDKMGFKSHFGKWLLRKWSGKNIMFSIYFILIQLWGKSAQIAFLNSKCHFLKMTQFQTILVYRLIFSELNTLQFCVLYHFKSNFAEVRDILITPIFKYGLTILFVRSGHI